MGTGTNERARRLFEGIAPRYDLPAEVFSFAQYGRWRRYMIARLDPAAGSLVLDVATGTGLVARDMRARGARVVGADLTPAMLATARARGLEVTAAQAEHLPFGSNTFDALTFTYLMRYVDDPAGTLAELARVVKPGGRIASVEFGVPTGDVTRKLWDLYALRVFPIAARAVSPGWKGAADFLGPSITGFVERMPAGQLAALWQDAGLTDVHTKSLSFGAGVVMWGVKA